jgi:integrase
MATATKLTTGPASPAKLQEINERSNGRGWIGYRTGCKFLYIAFYPTPGAPKKFLNTKSHDVEEAYRQLLEARGRVADGDRLLPQEVGRMRYENLIELLMKDWRDRKVASLFTRNDGEGSFGGKTDMDAFFKRMPLTEITATKIQEFIGRQRKKGYSDGTIRRQLNTLRAAFSIAKGLDLITDNHIPSFNLPKDSEARKGFLDVQDFEKFLVAFPENLRPTVLFLYYSGCRSGAAKQIKWAMVNPDCTEIHAPGSIIKNKTDWQIPLVGPLEPIAKVLKKLRGQAIPAPDAPVFDFTNFRKVWNKTCHNLGLGKYVTVKPDGTPTQQYDGLHAHDFRRSAARNLIKAGVSETVAMKITGHKTTSMFRRYAIQNIDDVRDALIKVQRYGKGKVVSMAKAGN